MKWLMALAIAGTCSFAQPEEVRRWADHWAGEYGVERELVYAVIEAESGGDARAISSAGAAGVMQLMPATADKLQVGDITQLEPNIHAGVKYIRQIVDQYYENEPMDALNKVLFAFASYNAGPARIRSLRTEAQLR